MVSLRRIFKDYQESGALHALISIQAAVGEGQFITRSGDLVMMLQLEGVAGECLDPGEIDPFARRFESALRLFDEHHRLYQYLLKRQGPSLPHGHSTHPVVAEATARRIDDLTSQGRTLYSLETYLAVVYEGWRPPLTLRERWTAGSRGAALLSSAAATHEMMRGMDRAQELLRSKVESLVAHWKDMAPIRILDSQQAFAFLRRLVNYSPLKAEDVRLKYDTFVDFQACDSALECHREFLRLDEEYIRVLTLKEPPSRTFAHLLRGLLEIPANYVIASEWKVEDPSTVRRILGSKRRHFHNLKTSLTIPLSNGSATTAQDRLIDDGAVALVRNLGGCLEEIEVHGRSFGQFSLTVALYDKDADALQQSVAQCYKIFATHDAQLTEERYNRLNAWTAMLPGNSAYNLRRLWLTSANYADLSFLFTINTGHSRNEHLGAEYLAIFEGTGGVPYFFNLHHKDVAHTFISGATGSGKSFLINFLVTHLQKYEPFTCIFDLGGSYETLTRLFGGRYLSVGASAGDFKINPFCLPPTPENLLFLFAFVRVLIESNGYALSAEDERDLYEQIENLYSVAADQRRLFTLSNIVRRNLRAPLQKWVQGGPYASWFDHSDDDLHLARFQTFNFEGMDKAGPLEPLLFYILHRANAFLNDPDQATVFKAFVMDEAWRFFRHPVVKAYIVEALKTWRKKNAAMILATQSSEDLMNSDMLPVVVESCPTKLFLSNPGMDQRAYREAFHLNETEAERIARLIPKRQILVKQPGASTCVELRVDSKGYWLYTNSPRDNARKRQVFERYGIHEGLEILSREAV